MNRLFTFDRDYETLCWFETHCPADIPQVQRDTALKIALRDARNHDWPPCECAQMAIVRLLREALS